VGRWQVYYSPRISCNPNLPICEQGYSRELAIGIRTGAGTEQRMSIIPRVEYGGLQESSRFSLGDHGALEVTVLPTKCCPVTIMGWSGVKSSTWNEMKEVGFNEQLFGRSRALHHKEHISGVWETRPLAVLIMSKSKKETVLWV
jgi:hypothetical protein